MISQDNRGLDSMTQEAFSSSVVLNNLFNTRYVLPGIICSVYQTEVNRNGQLAKSLKNRHNFSCS